MYGNYGRMSFEFVIEWNQVDYDTAGAVNPIMHMSFRGGIRNVGKYQLTMKNL